MCLFTRIYYAYKHFLTCIFFALFWMFLSISLLSLYFLYHMPPSRPLLLWYAIVHAEYNFCDFKDILSLTYTAYTLLLLWCFHNFLFKVLSQLSVNLRQLSYFCLNTYGYRPSVFFLYTTPKNSCKTTHFLIHFLLHSFQQSALCYLNCGIPK